MNVLFLTQGRTLSLFHDLATEMQANGGVERAGYYVTDSAHFDRFRQQRRDFPSSGAEIVKEWEILAKADRAKPDMAHLKEMEKRLAYGGAANGPHEDAEQKVHHHELKVRLQHLSKAAYVKDYTKDLMKFCGVRLLKP